MVAWAFFAYLNDKKQVDFYHSLPISRGRLFFSRSAAALLSLWSAYALNLLLALLVAWIMGMAPLMQGLPVLTGLANHLLFSLALFFTAALATELTGIQAISTALTLFFLGVFPSFIWIIRKLASCFYPNFYGELYDWQTPLFWSSPLARYIQAAKENQLLATDYLWIGAGTALLAAAALALHLRRPSEAAGRAVTFRWAEPLLKYIVALWAALGLAALFAVFFRRKRALWIFALPFLKYTCKGIIAYPCCFVNPKSFSISFLCISSFFTRSMASAVRSLLPKAVSRKKPSPFLPKPAPGVPTTLASWSSRSKNAQESMPFGQRSHT